jgi:hypothetical protein
VLEHSSGLPVWWLALHGDQTHGTRHVVGSTHVARLEGTPGKEGLRLIAIHQAPGPVTRNDPGPAKPPAVQPEPVVRWQVRPDPLPAGLSLPEKPEGSLPITGYPPLPNNIVEQVVFPTSPSPFVTVAVKGRIQDAHEVWDLRTMKRVGLVDLEHPFSDPALSPDGAYFAVPTFQLKQAAGTDVYPVAGGKMTRITVADKSRWFNNVDFAGPGQVATFIDALGNNNLDVLVQVWDIKTRAEVRRFTAPAHHCRGQQAFSPGRRYVALMGNKDDRVLLYDLGSGQFSGSLPLPAAGACLGLSFAADGKSLAGLFKAGDGRRLLAWDLATGNKTADHPFQQDPVPNVGVYRGPAVEWQPDGGGWLLYGRAFVDARSGAVYFRLNPPDAHSYLPRHLFGDRLAYVKGTGAVKSLVFEPLPVEEMAAALKAARVGH